MKVLVAFERSGVVRRAFRDRGHDAYSCDLVPEERGYHEHHLQGDALEVMKWNWDLIIAQPALHLLGGVRNALDEARIAGSEAD